MEDSANSLVVGKYNKGKSPRIINTSKYPWGFI